MIVQIVYVPYWEHPNIATLKSIFAATTADYCAVVFDGGDCPDEKIVGVEYIHKPQSEGVVRALGKLAEASYVCILRQSVVLHSAVWDDIQKRASQTDVLYTGDSFVEDYFLMMNQRAYRSFLRMDVPIFGNLFIPNWHETANLFLFWVSGARKGQASSPEIIQNFTPIQ